MPKTNNDRLVMLSVAGEVAGPRCNPGVYRVDREGRGYILPGEGGISLNVHLGDGAYDWAGDNVHPGAAVYHEAPGLNASLNYLACIGNEAVITSGDAVGATGVVVGKHGFVDGFGLLDVPYLIVEFPIDVLAKLGIGDKVQVKSHGRGLEIEGYSDVRVKNCSPQLLNKLLCEPDGNGALVVPVAGRVPARLMGEGSDERSERGARSISGGSAETMRELGLSNLRLGDIVALEDQDHSFGRSYRPGAVTIGVIVHGDSPMAGHGPGVTTLLTCATGRLRTERDAGANLMRLLGLSGKG